MVLESTESKTISAHPRGHRGDDGQNWSTNTSSGRREMAEQKSIWVFIEQDGRDRRRQPRARRQGPRAGRRAGLRGLGCCAATASTGWRRTSSPTAPTASSWPTTPSWRSTGRCPTPASPSPKPRARKPEIFLIGATPNGRDLAPRVASALRCGLTADCTDLQIGDYDVQEGRQTYKDLLYQIRPAFGGNLIATIVNPNTRPQMATVREGVMRKPAADASRTGVDREGRPRRSSRATSPSRS